MDAAPVGAWAQNVSTPVAHSPAVGFLGSLPRWGGRRTLALSVAYVQPTALSGLIPIIAGALVTGVLLAALVVRMFPRRRVVDAQLRRVMLRPRRHLWQLPLSWALVYLAVLFVALGAVALGVLVNALHDAVGVLSALLATVARAGFAVVDLFLLFVARLETLRVDGALTDRLPVPDGLDAGVVAAAFGAMRDYSVARMPDVHPLSLKLEEVITRIERVLRAVDDYASLVYVVFLGLLLVQLLAPAVHFLVDVLYARRWGVRWRFVLSLVYIFFPSFAGWLLLGATTSAGVLVADVCAVVHDYRDHLLDRPSKRPDNPIVAANFTCVPSARAQGIKAQVDAAIAPLKAELAGSAVQVILNRSADEVLESANWTATELAEIVDCRTLIEISGRLEHIICGNHKHSAARGIADMWVAFLGLALALGCAFLVSTVGVRTAWSTLVFPFKGILLPYWEGEKDEKGGGADAEQKGEQKGEKKGEKKEGHESVPDLITATRVEPVGITALSLGGSPATSPAESPRSDGTADDGTIVTGRNNAAV